jgi:DNA recombination protein RmuC
MSIAILLVGLVLGAALAALVLVPRLVAARAELAGAAARLQAREQAGAALRHEFAALSSEALRANNDQFLALARAELRTLSTAADGARERGQHALGELVGPLRESLARVDDRLGLLERERVAGRAELSAQLRALVESSERLRGETNALVSALRRPQTRGRWGEMQLRRVVELVGMTAHCDFVEQRSVAGEDGLLRPDLIVQLPGGRQVIVDAKAPLQPFLDACDAPEEDARERHLAAHARVLREHMRRLGAKAYWAQFDAAPDFVVMFLPAEHFHQAALEAAPDLLEEGVREHVLIATPMTLIALLRAVSYGWQQERVADSARAIGQAGRELHERLGLLVERVDRVGQRLSGTVTAYNEAVGTLQARVLPSARRLAEHGVVADGERLADARRVGAVPRALAGVEHVEDAAMAPID